MHNWEWQKFLDKVGIGQEHSFDGGLVLPEAAGFDFWFEQRSIDVIIDGLRRAGDVISVKFLEQWKQGPGDELRNTTQAVLKEHQLAAFKKLTSLIPRPGRDTNPLTHSLDDSALSLDDPSLRLLYRPSLGRREGWRDDISLADNVVYKHGAMPIGGLIKNQLGSGGGAEQHHGRPPDSQGVPDKAQPKKKRLFGRAKRRHGRPPGFQGPTTISPPSATALKDSSMLSVGAAAQSAMGDTVTGTFLSTFSVVSKPGSAASATKHDETSMKSPAPRTLNLP